MMKPRKKNVYHYSFSVVRINQIFEGDNEFSFKQVVSQTNTNLHYLFSLFSEIHLLSAQK